VKCEANRTQESGRVEFAGKALVQILLSVINSVSGFMEGVIVYLVNCRMELDSHVRGVLMGSCFK